MTRRNTNRVPNIQPDSQPSHQPSGQPSHRLGHRFSRLGLIGVLLSAAWAMSQPASAQATAPVTPKTWGRYTLKLSPPPTADTQVSEAGQTLTLLDGKKVVLKVNGFFVSAELQFLRPGGLPELVVSSFSGGAHCCTTYLLYTQDGGRLENMGILDMGNYSVGFRDLNGDGNREVIVQSDNLAYYDWSYADSPDLKTVLGWDGLRLADRTRFYAYLPAQNAAYYLKQAREVPTDDATYIDSLKSMVSGYFGNMILAGKGVEAEKLITEQFFPKSALLKAWWPKNRNALIGLTYGQPEARITVSNTAVWPVPDENTDSP